MPQWTLSIPSWSNNEAIITLWTRRKYNPSNTAIPTNPSTLNQSIIMELESEH